MSVAEPGNCWDAIPGVEDYDSILNILDFPLESLEDDGFVSDWDITKSHCLGPIPSVVLMDSKPPFLSPSSGLVPPPNKPPEESSSVFQTQSPVSVLESNGPGPAIINTIPVRARSKRVKRQSPWLSASSTYFTSGERREIPIMPPVVTKRCAHCDVTKTPQWREGPMGPKTLCNACGVRYRSGRLFPEYRPAASPTFVPALHSNSHKKVIEMRTKRRGPRAGVEKRPTSPQPEFVPMSNYLFDYMY